VLRASYGEGFKAPTLYQLFSEYGNLALRPESAEGWDAGIEQRVYDDAIMLPRCTAQPFGFYDNVQRTAAWGIELAASAMLSERVKLSANYTHTDATNEVVGGANFGNELARRPQNIANAQLSYRWPFRLETTVAVQHVGASFDDAANLVPLEAYTLVDFRVTRQLSDRLQMFARLENALDEEYQTTAHYGSIGRGIFVGARTDF
jgi:vitamin B12 transporter